MNISELKIGDKVYLSDAAHEWALWSGIEYPVGYVRGIDDSVTSLPVLIGFKNEGNRGSLNTRWFSEDDILGKVDDTNGEFIVWSPDSDKPVKERYYSYDQARYVARKMTGAHGGTFYVMQTRCKYTRKTEVIKEEV